MKANADSVDDDEDEDSSDVLELDIEDAVVVEFREKLDVKNPVDVDEDSILELVVLLPMLLVTDAELVIGVVVFIELEVAAEVVSFAEIELVVEEVSLGASRLETSLRTPDTTDTGTLVAMLTISDSGSDTDA